MELSLLDTTKSFSERKTAQTHMLNLFLSILLTLNQKYIFVQGNKQYIKNKTIKISNYVDSIHISIILVSKPLLTALKVLPSQLHFILPSTLTLISAIYVIFISDLCLNLKSDKLKHTKPIIEI